MLIRISEPKYGRQNDGFGAQWILAVTCEQSAITSAWSSMTYTNHQFSTFKGWELTQETLKETLVKLDCRVIRLIFQMIKNNILQQTI